MNEKEIKTLLASYYEEGRYLEDELDYATSKPAYASYGLGVKEAYLEFANEVNYDE
jgi:hypothetical protein